MARARVPIAFEVRQDDRADVLFPVVFAAVEDIDARGRERVGVRVGPDGRVQRVFERLDDVVAAVEGQEAVALSELVKQPVVVVDLIFGFGLDDLFPVTCNSLTA